ncbi:MAG: hypothetical protein LUI06_04380 [Ruminococcus sp.]|nr:hypothetical protein [Ruminococcus sp.]
MESNVKKSWRERLNLFGFERTRVDVVCLLLYVVLVSIVSAFHEPWFDEIQAWSIAKTASLHDILFVRPHYEGHPPLWSLLLAIPARLGVNPELGLKSVNIIIMTIAMGIIIFKSPFPNVVRRLIPFSFFYFYQFGVVSRCYSLFTLGMVLVALTFSKRDQKPIPFVLSMMLLCGSHAYGIIISGMICIVWVVEIFSSHKKNDKLSNVFKDKRCYSLLVLAIFAVSLILMIIPASDVTYDEFDVTIYSLANYVIYAFDSLLGVFVGYYAYKPGMVIFIFEIVCGILVLVYLYLLTKRTKLRAYFFITYFALVTFMIFKYSSIYHLGTCTSLILFIVWVSGERDEFEFIKLTCNKFTSLLKSKYIRKVIICGILLVLTSPVIASVYASIMDVNISYGFAKDMAAFLKENNLDDRLIMSEWAFQFDEDALEKIYEEKGIDDDDNDSINKDFNEITVEEFNEVRDDYNISYTAVGTALDFYFDDNIIMNLNPDDPSKTYVNFQKYDEEQQQEFCDLIEAQGYPEVIVGTPYSKIYPFLYELSIIYGEDDFPIYREVYTTTTTHIWKFSYDGAEVSVYVREDVLEEYPELEVINEINYLD